MKRMSVCSVAGATTLGAVLMAILDPQQGRRRRALVRDKTTRAGHALGDAAGTTWRDLSHRISGAVAGARGLFEDVRVPDETLVERVRSRIGRLVSHPASIEVSVAGGSVRLAGPVLKREINQLLRGIRCVPGVTGVQDRLDVHERPGRVPGLQGGQTRRDPQFELLQENWSPTARLLAGMAGGGIAILGARRGDRLGAGLAAVGSGILLRALTNLPAKRLFGLGPARRGIDIRKSVTIAAPVDEVFALWSRWENFPRFFSHVSEVRDHGNGRTHWKVEGPAGTVLNWDAVVTASIPNQLLAWKSVRGEAVRHSGLVRFDPAPGGGTRVDIRMTYKPPAGALGHAVAALFGADPKSALDDDMVRLKSLFEQGATEAHGKDVTLEDALSPVGEAAPPPPKRRRTASVATGDSPRKGPHPDA